MENSIYYNKHHTEMQKDFASDEISLGYKMLKLNMSWEADRICLALNTIPDSEMQTLFHAIVKPKTLRTSQETLIISEYRKRRLSLSLETLSHFALSPVSLLVSITDIQKTYTNYDMSKYEDIASRKINKSEVKKHINRALKDIYQKNITYSGASTYECVEDIGGWKLYTILDYGGWYQFRFLFRLEHPHHIQPNQGPGESLLSLTYEAEMGWDKVDCDNLNTAVTNASLILSDIRSRYLIMIKDIDKFAGKTF